jgi:hypothetical protein
VGGMAAICDPWLVVHECGRFNMGVGKVSMNSCEVGFNRTKCFLTFKITWIRSLHLLITYFDISPKTPF